MASLTDALVQQLLNGRYIASLATQKRRKEVTPSCATYSAAAGAVTMAAAIASL